MYVYLSLKFRSVIQLYSRKRGLVWIVDCWFVDFSGVIGLLFVNLLIDPCGFMWIAIKIKLDRPSCWFEYNSSV